MSVSVGYEAKMSVKWAAILFIPVLIAVLVVAGVLGGIHGAGKSVLFAFVAPVLVLQRPLAYANPFVVWSTIIAVELVYFFLIIFILRLLRIHVPIRAAGKKVLPYLKEKAPPQV